MRCASEGNSGDDIAPSFRRGLPEVETLPGDGQESSPVADSDPDICDDAVDVRERSLEGDLVCCFDDRLDLLGGSSAKLTDDPLRVWASSLLSGTSRYLSSSTSPIVFSSSSRSSVFSSLSFPALPLVIKYTPTNVNAQPPKNLPNRLASAAWKSRYSTALPIMTEIVKRTNCTGMTWVESNLCRARLTYRICANADITRMKTSRYVMGKVRARHRVSDSKDATPLVDKAV